MVNVIVCVDCKSSFETNKRADTKRCDGCKKLAKRRHAQKPEIRARRIEIHRKFRERIFLGYGGSCACCGETRVEFLAIDHSDGNGSVDRRSRSFYQIMRHIVDNDFPDNYRILCHNCNLSIGFYGYCPHKQLQSLQVV